MGRTMHGGAGGGKVWGVAGGEHHPSPFRRGEGVWLSSLQNTHRLVLEPKSSGEGPGCVAGLQDGAVTATLSGWPYSRLRGQAP